MIKEQYKNYTSTKCALCKEEKELMKSHIIPSLVYKRIRSNKHSRFRSLDNIEKVLQDGEKRPMLCHECEELFSSFERLFANKYLDVFINTNKIPKITGGWLDNYILTVAWRILYDDLYRMNSHEGSVAKHIFDDFCFELGDYLLSLNHSSNEYPPKKFKNTVYRLKTLVKNKKINNLVQGSMFGYTYWDAKANRAIVIVYYANLVFVTEYLYDRRKYKIIGGRLPFFKRICNRKTIRSELNYQFKQMAKQYKTGMNPELQRKIQDFYDTHN